MDNDEGDDLYWKAQSSMQTYVSVWLKYLTD